MNDQSCDDNNTVTLVMREFRFQVNKNILIRSSRYFTVLFSKNFNDHRQKEFPINYEWSRKTMQTFVDWTNDEINLSTSDPSATNDFAVKKSLKKFVDGNRSELLELLELSGTFSVYQLTKDIENAIAHSHLKPAEMLEIWLLAEHLGLDEMRDEALAVCLDRFEELKLESILSLNSECFIKLAFSVNLRSSEKFLRNVHRAWVELHGTPINSTVSREQFAKDAAEDIIEAWKEIKPHHVQCVVGRKSNGAQAIYVWNGETLRELTEVRRDIVVRRVVARRFNIYAVGRQPGNFLDTNIYRYSIFTKKWYNETSLPQKRRASGVAVLKNKLYFFGGLGPNHRKLQKEDVYNLHTGKWTSASDASVVKKNPAKIRSACTVDGKILCLSNQDIFTYKANADKWEFIPVQATWTTWTRNLSLLGTYRSEKEDTKFIYIQCARAGSKFTTLAAVNPIDDDRFKTFHMITPVRKWPETDVGQLIMNGPYTVSFGYNKGVCRVELGRVSDSKERFEKLAYKCTRIYTREMPDVSDDFLKVNVGCFNMIEPQTFRTLIFPIALIR